VHFALTEADGNPTRPWAEWSLAVAAFIEATLDQGFTTVRDAGALDPAWSRAVAHGRLRGPRILPSGAFLSQTGGHGDWRAPDQDSMGAQAPVEGLFAGSVLADGPDAVRRAARDQLRRGATQVKVMASGGVVSPTDPIEATQFTLEELRAAVEEADARGTYVLAHAYHPKAIGRCLDAGVRSIEHGNLLDEATAARMAKDGAFLVPTLVVYGVLVDEGERIGFSGRVMEKARMVARGGEEAVRMAHAAGVKIGSGSDLLGPAMNGKAGELAIKARLIGPRAAIVSATKTNAELFGLADEIGTVEEGKRADLIIVDGDPLADIGALTDAQRVRVVVQGGSVVKDLDAG